MAAAVVISSPPIHSSLSISKLSSSSPQSKSPFFSIRSSYSHPSLSSHSFPRSERFLITAFLDLDDSPYAITDDLPFEDVKIVEEIKVVEELDGGFDGGVTGDGGEDGGGDGGDGGGEGGEGEGEEGESGKEKKKKGGMSMSQKLTLGYAALVGVGGIMGYMKSGSQKSLAAGGGSALLLYYVYTQLPVRPAFASSIGLGLSSALLAVMGSRFKRSGKVFPAGIVSIVSFIMAGGYLHGILRSLHA